MNDIREYLIRRISHTEKRVAIFEKEHGKNPNETHNYFGGQSLGYWQGMLAAYENILWELEERYKRT